MELERYQLVYKIEKNKTRLRLLGEEFYQRNKSSGHIIYKNKKFRLSEKIETKNLEEKELKIDMIFYKIINNKSFMFENCDALLKFSQPKDEDKNYYSQIIKINEEEENLFDFIEEDKIEENLFMKDLQEIESFHDYSLISQKMQDLSITTVENIYNNIKKVSNIKNDSNILTGMFYNCSSLISLNDIKKWNISNVTNIGGMFYNCSSLTSLPDLSKWNTSNVTDMNGLFANCLCLISLPDISVWNTNNIHDISAIFYNCSSLKDLPDISKWNTFNVNNISRIFENCS